MDLASGHLCAMEYLLENHPNIECFNLGTGLGTSVLELVKVFKK